MVKTVSKKCWPGLFNKVLKGDKCCDVRINDFRIKADDILRLREWNPKTKKYTGRELSRVVKRVNKLDLFKFYKPADLKAKGIQVIELMQASE